MIWVVLAMSSHMATPFVLRHISGLYPGMLMAASRTGIAPAVPLLPKANDRSKGGSHG